MKTEAETQESFKVRGTEAVFASDLGWKPGIWPKIMTHNGVTFERLHPIAQDTELIGVLYRQAFTPGGVELMIYND